jgi:hypothetical protein
MEPADHEAGRRIAAAVAPFTHKLVNEGNDDQGSDEPHV